MAVQKQVLKTAEKSANRVSVSRQKMVRERLLEASKNIETGYITMAEFLNEAYHREYWKESWGFESFTNYAESELNIDYRKARYLIDIWDKVKGLDLPKAQVAKIGWTRMKEIAVVITKENAKVLLEQAQKMSSRELTESVKLMRKTGHRQDIPQAPSTLKINLILGESEHQIVMEALDAAKKLCNSDSAALAMGMICEEWLTDKGAHPEATHLEDHIKYLEAVFPVKISFKIVEKKKAAEAQKTLKKAEQVGKGKQRIPDPDDLDVEESHQDIDDLIGE